MQSDWSAVEIIRAEGQGPVVLVCEHAAKAIPAEFDGLGLAEDARQSHAAWDIGARDVAVELSALFDAPLVAGTVSRLVYDLNRPLESASAIPEKSEVFEVPGNAGLSDAARRARYDACHVPFHAAVAGVLDARAARPAAFVTVHSFTPVYNGVPREVDIGFLHDARDHFARAALAVEDGRGQYRAALNEPYGIADGVTHSLSLHGEARGLPTLMIEVRNDLIATPEAAREMAGHLHGTLSAALSELAEVTR